MKLKFLRNECQRMHRNVKDKYLIILAKRELQCSKCQTICRTIFLRMTRFWGSRMYASTAICKSFNQQNRLKTQNKMYTALDFGCINIRKWCSGSHSTRGTRDFMETLFDHQDGLCAITKYRMTFRKDCQFALYLDRVDSDLGYVW